MNNTTQQQRQWPAHTASGANVGNVIVGAVGAAVVLLLGAVVADLPLWLIGIAVGIPLLCMIAYVKLVLGGPAGISFDGLALRFVYGRRAVILPVADLQWQCGMLGYSPTPTARDMTGTVLHLRSGTGHCTVLASDLILGDQRDYTMAGASSAQLQIQEAAMRDLLAFLGQLGRGSVSLSPPRALHLGDHRFDFQSHMVSVVYLPDGRVVAQAPETAIRVEPAHTVRGTGLSFGGANTQYQAMVLVVHFPGLSPFTLGAPVSAPWMMATPEVSAAADASPAMLKALATRLGLGSQMHHRDSVSYGLPRSR